MCAHEDLGAAECFHNQARIDMPKCVCVCMCVHMSMHACMTYHITEDISH